MVAGLMELHLRLEGCKSLKDKRHVVRSLIDKSRSNFHISVAEVGDYELWGNSVVGIACVSNNAGTVETVLQHVLDMFDEHPSVSVEGVQREVERFP